MEMVRNISNRPVKNKGQHLPLDCKKPLSLVWKTPKLQNTLKTKFAGLEFTVQF